MRNDASARAPRLLALLGAAALCVATGAATAGTPSSAECAEAADFIGNAAQARENGMTRTAFLDQMQSDFDSIRTFPNELRWFVHDENDETFLLDAAREVFDRPQSPQLHRVAFFHGCMSRLMV